MIIRLHKGRRRRAGRRAAFAFAGCDARQRTCEPGRRRQQAERPRSLPRSHVVPDKAIPRELLQNAEAVAIFPTFQAVYLGRGRGGKASQPARSGRGSAPAVLQLGGGSFGRRSARLDDFVLSL